MTRTFNLSSEKETDVSFSERLLRLISEKANGKPARFAKKAGISHTAMFNYVEGRLPAPDILVRIRDTYGVNVDWLLTGKGEPYSVPVEGRSEEPAFEYNLPGERKAPGGEVDPIDELLGMARKVLSSENKQAADALERNIRYFLHAVEIEKRLAKVESRLESIEEAITKKAG
jgi:transcriptional regulator with XRE-family HTH domain